MPVDIQHFRQCHQTRCVNYGGFWFAHIENCPLCNERGVYVGAAAKVSVEEIGDGPEPDWTHGQGYDTARPEDVGL